jgi:hypothetical protein
LGSYHRSRYVGLETVTEEELTIVSNTDGIWLHKLGKRGYIQIWFLSKKIPTAGECGAALDVSLEERQIQPGSWGGCRTEYISTTDITRAIRMWDNEPFRSKVQSIVRPGGGQSTDAQQNDLQPASSEGDGAELEAHPQKKMRTMAILLVQRESVRRDE